MAINKKLIHFNTFENFNSKKLSANVENTQYTLGVDGEVQTGSPDILYQSICWIKDTKQQWTHGQLYDGGSTEANVQAVDTSETLDDVSGNTYVKYVAQTLTEEQKAQVRENIGVSNSTGGNGTYSEVSHGTADTSFILTPNTFHIWDEVSSLTLTLGAETSGVANEYIFQFTSGSEPTTLSLPDDIKWTSGETPTIEANKIYQVSILKGLGSVLSWDNVNLIIFTVGDTQYNAEPDMNWINWVNSKYNVDSFSVDAVGIFIPSRETYLTRPDESGLVIGTDIIIPNGQYLYMD